MGVMNVSYLTVNGEILSETRNGVESDYVPDPLGSTAALIGASQAITDTFAWWPYGERRSHSGPNVTPFGYAGTLGYYIDSQNARSYVRASTLRPSLTRWQAVDPLWPSQLAFVYVRSGPTLYADPSGMQLAPPLSAPPNWFPSAPSPVRPSLPPVPPVQGCIIVCGIEACYELCTYRPGHPTGPFTALGDCIGASAFPGSSGSPAPAPIPQTPHRKPPRPGCKNQCPSPCYRLDRVPPGRPHRPFPGDHIEWYVYHQSPDCKCHPKWEVPYAWPQGQPGPISIQPCGPDILR